MSRDWLERQLPGRRARIAALVIALLLVTGIVWFALELHSRHALMESRFEQITPHYARLSGLLEDKLLVQQALAESRAELSRYGYLPEIPVDRVGIELQQKIRNVVEAAGTSVISSQVLPPQESEHFQVVAVSVTIGASAAQLRDVITGLTREEPSVQVDSINLTQGRGRDHGSGLMSVTLNASVLRLKP